MTVRTQAMNEHTDRAMAPRTFGDSFKAGLMGGFAIGLLLLVYQISPNFLQTVLIPPALFIVWVVTGIGAAMLCDDKIETGRDGGRVGLVAGLVAGVIGGMAGMIIASFGLAFQNYGQGFLENMTDSNMAILLEAGFTEELVALAGSILTAMFSCGLGGMIIAGLLGWIGGWLYPKFSK